ncbi:PAS domain-containing protein [Echinicola sediminis]
MIRSQDNLIQSQQFHNSIQKLISDVSGLESSERAYLLSGDEEFLKDFPVKKDSIFNTIKTIRQFVQSHNMPPEITDSLQHFVQERLDHLDGIILKFKSGHSHLQLGEELMRGDSLMRNIKGAASLMGYLNFKIFQERKFYRDQRNRVSPYFIVITFFFSLLLFTTAYFKINHDLKKKKLSVHQLEMNQRIFEKAEAMAETGHWKFDLTTKELYFSNNQHRILGYSPHEIKPDFTFFFRHIHRGDRGIALRIIKDLKHGLEVAPIDIRILTKAKEEKCLRLAVQMFHDTDGNTTVIGVNKDLTKIVESREKLEKLNKELTIQNNAYSNAEAIGHMGSISMDCNSLSLTLSNNMAKLLELNNEECIENIDQLKKYVYPEDLEILEGYFDCSKSGKIQDKVSFRLLQKSSNFIYVNSQKQILEEPWGKIMIIVLIDVTS